MEVDVIVKLRGGLGNQLFQYFGALEISKEIGARLTLDARALPLTQRINRQGVSLFPEEISSFVHQGHIIKSSSRNEFSEKLENYWRSRLDYLDRITGDSSEAYRQVFGKISGDKTVSRKTFPLHKDIIVVNNPLFNHEEFSYIQDGTTRQLMDVSKPSAWFQQLLRESLEVGPTALHLRLGDHFRLDNTIDLEYFSKALNFTEKRFPGSPIWVFSDQVAVAESFLKSIDPRLRYLTPPLDSRPIETLVLMAQCRSIITSKSSFSWWAANLGFSIGNSAIINRDWLMPEGLSRFMRFGNERFTQV
jgi:hypothetical protein